MARSARPHGPFAGADGLAVRDTGLGRDDDTRAGNLSAPAQVEVLTDDGNERIESTNRAKEVRAHQHDAAGRHEDVAL